MRLCIVGGVLQGMEAAYLAKKAGYETVVIDRWKDAPALCLADDGIIMDVIKERDRAIKLFSECDAVLPANENMETLRALNIICDEAQTPFLFDLKAYELSSSKVLSNDFMRELGVPLPAAWPECGFPVVVKPSGQSGSVGVSRANDQDEMAAGVKKVREMGDDAIIQEFVEGPNISIEVIGDGSAVMPMVMTEVVLDGGYDCRMVRCPVENIDSALEKSFIDLARKLSEGLRLRGIMDVEAIVKGCVPKVLEIDARIPSQTPAAVLGATGINLLERLVEALVNGRMRGQGLDNMGASVYEHVAVDDGSIRSCGEGTFSEVRNPRIEPGLFGSDEMITDYAPGRESWRATIICSGPTPEKAWEKRTDCLREIVRSNGLVERRGLEGFS